MRLNPASSGFTLVETLVSLVLLAFFLVGLAYLMSSTIQTNTQARRIAAATALAQQKLEELSNMSYNNLLLITGTDGHLLDENGTTTGARFYTRSWTGTDNSPIPDTKTVRVKVTWNDQLNPDPLHPLQVQLETIITQ